MNNRVQAEQLAFRRRHESRTGDARDTRNAAERRPRQARRCPTRPQWPIEVDVTGEEGSKAGGRRGCRPLWDGAAA